MASSSIHGGSSVRRAGFTMVECLIGLAITALLLAALATAFSASVSNYQENERMYWTVNNARQALTRMTSEIRTAGYWDETASPPDWFGVAHTDGPSSQCTLYLPNHEIITYEFRSADKKLYVVKNATNQSYVLCDNVTNVTFTTTSNNGDDATSVQISLTVQDGTLQHTLSAAAVLRRIPPSLSSL